MEKLRRVKAVLHDWDDVVVATFDPVFDLINNFAIQNGLPTHERESIHKVWGSPLKTFIPSLWPEQQDPDELVERYLSSGSIDFVKPAFPGVDQTIKQLYKSYTLGIVSSNRSNLIMKDLLRMRVSPMLYALIHGPDECSAHKPSPAVFDNALTRLADRGIQTNEVVYIGDDLRDYVAARDRGIGFLAVTTGFTTPEQFTDLGLDPKLILPQFTEVPAFLNLIKQKGG
jgi:HAD superfamily hydrolase (TIGR01549 family)